MEQRGRELDSWDKLVKKIIDAEAKAGLQSSSILREMDQHCTRDNRPAHTTVAKFPAHGTSTRDPREELSEEAKTQNPKPSHSSSHSSRSENAKTNDEKHWREIKQRRCQEKSRKEKKKQYCQEQARKGSTLATGGNATNMSGEARNGGARKDFSLVTCSNCDDKEHHSKNCPKPRKDASSKN